jgi:Na+/H+ antiporter NhaD/arsenite permease-like protein
MLALLALSLILTPVSGALRKKNSFTFGPIKEVAFLFAGIFTSMIPALYILEHNGAALGINRPWQFFWAAGGLSSFLDNAPTYLTFLSVAKGLNLPNDLGFVLNDGGHLSYAVLKAISCGAVFMGANTYIGNGPNFMVRSIAQEQGIKMPSFFGYMAYSGAILIPVFILLTFIFFI